MSTPLVHCTPLCDSRLLRSIALQRPRVKSEPDTRGSLPGDRCHMQCYVYAVTHQGKTLFLAWNRIFAPPPDGVSSARGDPGPASGARVSQRSGRLTRPSGYLTVT